MQIEAVLPEVLTYDPLSGDLHWKTYQNSQALAGQKAGSVDKLGYIVVGLKRKYHKAHRIAWFLTYGRWPCGYIDHINHCRADNRLINLREVTFRENLLNKNKSSANTSGYTGIRETNKGRWMVRICVNRKHICIGTFPSITEAIAARAAANVAYDFHPNHGY